MRAFLLTVSVLLVFIRENNGQPKVFRLPHFSVFVGDDITLMCKGTGDPIIWKIDDKEQSHKGYLMLLTMVTPENNGEYTCERNGQKSAPHNLKVLELEPYAQLSVPPGGTVLAKGDARVLTLHADEELDEWSCYVVRDGSAFSLHLDIDEMKTGRVHAELRDAQRATFWCINNKTKHRTNAVTLKMTERNVMLEPVLPIFKTEKVTLRCTVWGGANVEQADFYKDDIKIYTQKGDTYIITSATENNTGRYKCNAMYKYSHISSMAGLNTVESDPQELKVIGGPPLAVLSETNGKSLQCSCPYCNPDCKTYQWHHTDNSNIRRRLPEANPYLYMEEAGLYTCRAECEGGYSRFSNPYSHKGLSDEGGMLWVIILACLIILGLLIIILVAMKFRRRGAMQGTRQDKDGNGKKDKSGGDYEQIGLTNNALYHTLDEAKGQAKEEGGYEALKKTEDQAVYHTLQAVEGSSQAQGGYEPLQNVKVEVYQTLSSEKSGKPEGESEGGYEQLPQKTGDYQDVVVEENPYEELKAEKKKMQE